MSQRSVASLIVYNLKKLEAIFIIFGTLNANGHSMHFICDLALPGNTPAIEYARCILSCSRKKCIAVRSFFSNL